MGYYRIFCFIFMVACVITSDFYVSQAIKRTNAKKRAQEHKKQFERSK